MKRKDWKIKNLKKDIFDKNKIKIKRFRERFLFLRKLFIRKNKYLIKKSLFSNYIFYKQFLNAYKIKKQKYNFNLFWKTNIKKLPFFPEYAATKNVFNKKIKFKALKENFKIKLIFLPNIFNKKITDNNIGLFGLNYYIFSGNFSNFIKQLNEEDFIDLVHFKNNSYNFNYNYNLNFYFNYNLHNLCLLEIYKILILINLNLMKTN